MNSRTFSTSLFACLVLSACAGDYYHHRGISMIEEGEVERGVAALSRAVAEEPTNGQFKADLLSRRTLAIDRWLATAQRQYQAGQLEEAEAGYRRVLGIDPVNARARSGIEQILRERRFATGLAAVEDALKIGDPDKASSILRPILAERPDQPHAVMLKQTITELQRKRQAAEPNLRTSYTKPINLEFRDAGVKMVFEALARTTGISFIFDKDVRTDLKTTVFLKNAAIEDAIDLILQTNQLQRKILNNTSVLIYPNTTEKLKEYQDLVVKSFYLENADVKQIKTTLQTLLKTKDIVVDEKLNLLVMRDTPDAIRLAEKLVALHDLSEPEVMLEVEVLEVQRTRLLDLGVQWPNQLTLTPLTSGSGGRLTLKELQQLHPQQLGVALPDTVAKFQQDSSDDNLLANPRIRVKNREKAKILIGDKVPVVTSTSTSTGFVSGNVQYLDVGLKVEVEPDIHLQDELSIKVGLEVSSVVKEIQTAGGTLSYQIGTRSANTVLQLKDGETQILAGLIKDEDRKSASGVPGLSKLPVLGRLFGSDKSTRNKTEVVLSITPHLVRNLMRPNAEQGEFWSGTEGMLRTRPLSLQPMVVTPALEKPSAAREAPSPDPSESAAGSPSAFSRLSEAGKPLEPAKTLDLHWDGPAEVKVGEVFKLSLVLKSDGYLNSLPFQVGYDPEAFQVVQINEGEFFKQNDGATSFTSNIDTATGKFFATVLRTNNDGAAGNEVVAFVNLRALAAKPLAQVSLLAASPVVHGQGAPAMALPAPYQIRVVQ